MIQRFRHMIGAAVLATFVASPASAQLEDNLVSLNASQAQGYLSPLASGLSATMNSGIFRSGNIPFVGLNFTIDVKAAVISFSDDSRVFTTPEVPGFGSVEAPTVIGDTQSVAVPHESVPGLSFSYPGGFDLDRFGIAVPQLTVGSILGTRAMLRYITLELGDESDLGDFELIGIGAQHSISRYLPGFPVDIAAGVMWQQFKIGSDELVKATAVALNVTASRKMGAIISFEPYVGLGLDSFEMDARYDVTDTETLEVSFDRENDVHLTLGTNVNLPLVKVHAEVNVAAENGFAGGLSFGI